MGHDFSIILILPCDNSLACNGGVAIQIKIKTDGDLV